MPGTLWTPGIGRNGQRLHRGTAKRVFLGLLYLQKFVSLLPCKLFTCFAVVFPAKSVSFELISDLG